MAPVTLKDFSKARMQYLLLSFAECKPYSLQFRRLTEEKTQHAEMLGSVFLYKNNNKTPIYLMFHPKPIQRLHYYNGEQ